ncbi:MAG TPA: hypothetical protein VE967_16330 [Gemmatimonadaceae bacterium]|nr:hypothetical protein [Gemmatimonadaceae bacterium]
MRCRTRLVQTAAWAIMLVGTATHLCGAQAGPPVRDLGAISAKTSEPIGQFFGMWAYSDGRVLANDAKQRRLILFDAALSTFSVVADTMGSTPLKYGPGVARMVPYVGDSVLLIDFPSQSLIVLGPGARVVRTMAAPKVQDLSLMGSSAAGADASGRLYYRGILRPPPRMPGAPPAAPSDSAPIVRANFETRTIDTIGKILTGAGAPLQAVQGTDGLTSFKQVVNPVTSIDEWSVLPDGSVAFVRGHDYHIDWVFADGTKRSTAKLPFDWRRLTDEDKQNLIDSARRAIDARDPGGKGGLTIPEAIGRNVAEASLHIVTNADGSRTVPLITEFVPLREIQDYVAPIRTGAVRGDADGRLWILPTTSARPRHGGLVYDIVNKQGELTERVELPTGRSIVGFGANGAVYLLSGDRAGGFFIERASFR